jgi:hypothetical protein
MVEFADFNHGPMETPMTETTLPLIELLQKQDDGDFLRSVVITRSFCPCRAVRCRPLPVACSVWPSRPCRAAR